MNSGLVFVSINIPEGLSNELAKITWFQDILMLV